MTKASLTRRCEKYLAQLSDKMDSYDAVVSLACGCGVQYMAEMYNNKIIYPGWTPAFGGQRGAGALCRALPGVRRCIPGRDRRICPIARCSKRMLNGPCGGSENGKCEINKDIPCGWG